MLAEVTNKTKSRIDLSVVKKIAEKFLLIYKLKKKEVSIVFIGDQEMKRINYKYRKKNKTTDVLSFGVNGNESFVDNDFFGEILINYQQIKRQAKDRKVTIKEELIFILVHGLIHLLGYDDKTAKQAQVMEDLGNKFIKRISKKSL